MRIAALLKETYGCTYYTLLNCDTIEVINKDFIETDDDIIDDPDYNEPEIDVKKEILKILKKRKITDYQITFINI